MKGVYGSVPAVLWHHGNISILGSLRGYSYPSASGLNDNGQVTGYSITASQEYHGVVWDNSKMIDLGIPTGFDDSQAMGINNKGVIIADAHGKVCNRSIVWTPVTKSTNPVHE